MITQITTIGVQGCHRLIMYFSTSVSVCVIDEKIEVLVGACW